MSDTTPIGKTLYLCYFWLDTPLVQTQVLPYLRELVKGGIEVHLLTFERERLSEEQVEENRQMLAEQGIIWDYLIYHKRFSVIATLYDIFCGTIYTWKKNRREKFNILHARIHFPALMALIARKLSFQKPKILFDIRGFIADEYTDAGSWKKDGIIYKTVKRLEKTLLRDCDGFVVLTEKAREILFPESKENGFDKLGRPIEVIPCCVDLKRFDAVNNNLRNEMRRNLAAENRRIIIYVGSFGGFYMARETADFYGAAKRQNPDTFALILTQTPKEMIEPLLKEKGFTDKDFFIQKVSPKEVPAYLNAADIAVSFIKPCYSKLSSSPTKNAEYLASGLPIITNSGIGDVKEHTGQDKVGYVIDEFNEESYEKALHEIEKLLQEPDLAARCKASAKNRFGLETIGGEGYRRLYARMLKPNDEINKDYLNTEK